MAAMDTNEDYKVQEAEFVTHMLAASEGVSDATVDGQIRTVLQERVTGRFRYDFSAACCGSRGALPIMAVLRADHTCESVDFSNCGLHTEAICELADVAATHPVRLQRSALAWRTLMCTALRCDQRAGYLHRR